MNKKEFIKRHQKLACILFKAYNAIQWKNKFKIGKNKLEYTCALLKNVRIIINGSDNKIILGNLTRLSNSAITITGSHNTVYIGENCLLNQADFYIEDDNNEIVVGNHTSIQGKTHLAAIEGKKIHIGEDCMFSSDIHIRTGDSHSILDLSGNRINPSKDIFIGNHVWVGMKVTLLKNASVADDCVVAACALLSKPFERTGCIIGGVPAKIMKTDIQWVRPRL